MIKIFNNKADAAIMDMLWRDKKNNHFFDLFVKIFDKKADLNDTGVSNLSSLIVLKSDLAYKGNASLYVALANLLNVKAETSIGVLNEFYKRYATPTTSYSALAEIELNFNSTFIGYAFVEEINQVSLGGSAPSNPFDEKRKYFMAITSLKKIIPYVKYIASNTEKDGESVLYALVAKRISKGFEFDPGVVMTELERKIIVEKRSLEKDIRMEVVINATKIKNPELALTIAKMMVPYLNSGEIDKNLLKPYIETAEKAGLEEAIRLKQKLF